MKDFEKLQKECLAEVKAAGITPADNIKWIVNSRAKSRWGLCTRKNNGEYYEIQISNRLLEDDNISVKACKDTMIHEILHTCPDCMKHTGKWKEYARIMNTKYGYNIKSTTSGEEKGVENYKAKKQSIKFMFSCRYCSHIELYKKKCKFTHYYKNYSCSVCGQPRAYRKIEVAGKV